MFPPYKYIITRILRNVNKNIRKIRKNSRDFHTTKLNLPTGALDSRSSRMLLESFNFLNTELLATILMVTHDAFTASYAGRVIFIKDGKIFNEIRRGESTRKEFFDKIIDVVTLLGGDLNNAL